MATSRIRVYGIVQGVGFRPTVARHATTASVTGTVANKGPYVEIFAQGSEAQVKRFLELLRTEPPKRSAILKIDVKPAEGAPAFERFEIIESERTRGEIFISPDIAICDECATELFDPANRRYLHPFINCTSCGPRMTILEALPYDRERTSMKEFPMCDACASEYYSPASRRYDAQPVCCNECGPQVYLLDRPKRGRDAICEARRTIAQGGIVAVKGIGGFHLCCDATNEQAVELLRTRKHRSVKPFAIMARDLAVAQREGEVSDVAEALLTGHQKPIVLLPKRAGGKSCEAVAPSNPKIGVMLPYAPLQLLLFDYDDGRTMPDVLVMTSANESGAPICRDDEDARRELTSLADVVLSHNRQIRVRADDTVMDVYRGKPYMIRRSRGYAPLPFALSERFGAHVLAVGGELKNSFALGTGDLVYPSPYIGDLEDLRTVGALEETVARAESLLEFAPSVVACDLHPAYNSTQVAQRIAHDDGLPIVAVQHHYAHIMACMAENDAPLGEPVIGVSFDGTGYGEDGSIWGGEILLADAHGFERLGHIAPFAQAGGDLSAREGWRVAAGMIEGEHAPELAEQLGLCTFAEARIVRAMIERGVNCVRSTSAGRLFDAVSAVLGIRRASSYEGEAATQLQFAAERAREHTAEGRCAAQEYQSWNDRDPSTPRLRLSAQDDKRVVAQGMLASGGLSAQDDKRVGAPEALASGSISAQDDKRVAAQGMLASGGISAQDDKRVAAQGMLASGGLSVLDDKRVAAPEASATGEPFVLPTDALFSWIVERRLAGDDPEALALAFHEALAELIVQACLAVRECTSVNSVALSGGCFQNLLLLELTHEQLEHQGFNVLTHSLVPPNDGGIALGQAVVAAQAIADAAASMAASQQEKE